MLWLGRQQQYSLLWLFYCCVMFHFDLLVSFLIYYFWMTWCVLQILGMYGFNQCKKSTCSNGICNDSTWSSDSGLLRYGITKYTFHNERKEKMNNGITLDFGIIMHHLKSSTKLKVLFTSRVLKFGRRLFKYLCYVFPSSLSLISSNMNQLK